LICNFVYDCRPSISVWNDRNLAGNSIHIFSKNSCFWISFDTKAELEKMQDYDAILPNGLRLAKQLAEQAAERAGNLRCKR